MRPTDVCHPNELRAPAPRAFPAHCRSFRCVDTPRRLRLRAALPGDRTFHDVRKTASADRHRTLFPSSTASRPGDTSVGVFFPRCWCDRASDTPVAIPGSPSRLTPPSRVLLSGRTSFFWKVSYGSEDAETAKTTVDAFSWKLTPRDDPGCLPSAGTLRRIRWPLQPRSRDLRTAFGDVETAGWRSLDTLGLTPVLSRL